MITPDITNIGTANRGKLSTPLIIALIISEGFAAKVESASHGKMAVFAIATPIGNPIASKTANNRKNNPNDKTFPPLF